MLVVLTAVGLFGCSDPEGRPTGLTTSAGTPSSASPLAVAALVNASAPRDDLLGSYICAGALVAPQTVVTAAHCVKGRAAVSLDVVIGADNLCHDGPVGGDRDPVRRIIDFEERDLALLQLARPSDLTPMRVAEPPQRAIGRLTALGWGRESEVGPSPCRRTAVMLDQLGSGDCAALFRDAAVSESRAWLCAKPALGETRNTCVGDSGGPVLAGSDVDRRLVAITSFGRDCRPNSAGAYATLDDLPALLAQAVPGNG